MMLLLGLESDAWCVTPWVNLDSYTCIDGRNLSSLLLTLKPKSCVKDYRFTRVMHAWKQYSLMHGEDRLLNLLLLTPNLWSVKSLTLFQLLAVWFICHILQNLGCTNDLFDAGFDVPLQSYRCELTQCIFLTRYLNIFRQFELKGHDYLFITQTYT